MSLLQGLLRWTRYDLPVNATPPAVSHIHGSAAGAIPGVVSSSLASITGRKGSMTGLVMGEANKDEVLDAFDGELSHAFCSVRLVSAVLLMLRLIDG